MENAPVTIVTSVPWEREWDIREFLRYGNSFPPTFPEDLLAHASPNNWPICREACKYDELERQYKCGARDNYVRIWYWTPLGWTSSDHSDVSFPLSGNRGYDSNRSVPFRAFTRHHWEFLRYGNAIQSRRERGYGQPVPVTQHGSIPTNNGARRAGSQLIDGDKPMSAYTSGILILHIWQVTTRAALRAGQNTFSNNSIIGATQS